MQTEIKKSRGRPRIFDLDEALEKALYIFWEKGYEGASLSEFTDALSINKPSLYAAFGNKEELFRKALSKYVSDHARFVKETMSEPTAFKVAQSFLFKAADFLTSDCHPKGCLIVQAAISIGDDSNSIKDLLIQQRLNYEKLLSTRFEKALKDGDLTEDAKPKLLAKYLATLHQGMSIQATNGATKEQLLEITELALENWPTKN